MFGLCRFVMVNSQLHIVAVPFGHSSKVTAVLSNNESGGTAAIHRVIPYVLIYIFVPQKSKFYVNNNHKPPKTNL